VVDALQALRGVSFVTAVGLVAEVGDIRRFTDPRELMAYLGPRPLRRAAGSLIAGHRQVEWPSATAVSDDIDTFVAKA
jgi:transposase